MNLPKYAWPDRSPHTGGEKDLVASFRGDDRDTITVAIERCEGHTFNLALSRSGLSESRFSKPELAHVLEIANILFSEL